MSTPFLGFSKEMIDFLLDLQLDNTDDKLPDNKEKYKLLITDPLTSLYHSIVPAVARISDRLDTKPSRCVCSPYTDRRYSPDKPLKDYLYLRFKLTGKAVNIPGLFFDMGAKGYSYGLRIYKQSTRGMEELRQTILTSPREFNAALNDITNNGFQIIGESYKQDHYAALPNCPVKELLNKKTFYIGKERPLDELVFSKELTEELVRGFSQMKNLLKLL